SVNGCNAEVVGTADQGRTEVGIVRGVVSTVMCQYRLDRTVGVAGRQTELALVAEVASLFAEAVGDFAAERARADRVVDGVAHADIAIDVATVASREEVGAIASQIGRKRVDRIQGDEDRRVLMAKLDGAE